MIQAISSLKYQFNPLKMFTRMSPAVLINNNICPFYWDKALAEERFKLLDFFPGHIGEGSRSLLTIVFGHVNRVSDTEVR